MSRSKTKNRQTRRAIGNDRKEMVRYILDQGSTDGKMMLSTWFLHVFVNLNLFQVANNATVNEITIDLGCSSPTPNDSDPEICFPFVNISDIGIQCNLVELVPLRRFERLPCVENDDKIVWTPSLKRCLSMITILMEL